VAGLPPACAPGFAPPPARPHNEAVIRRAVLRTPATGAAVLALGAVLAQPGRVLAHGEVAPPPRLPDVLLAWRLDPVPILGVVAAVLLYAWAVRRVNAAHPKNRVPSGRVAFWLAGCGALLLALVSPIEAYEGTLFSVHMVQHLVLEFVAAPLLLAARPITLALRAATPSVRRRLLAILQSGPMHVLAHPIVAWLLFAVVNWGWHFSALYDAALENPPLHYFQHATFLGAALLFWWPVLAADPSPWRLPHPARILYLFLALPQNSFLGVALLTAGEVLYPHYLTNLREWGPSPIADQQIGALLMWTVGDLAFLAGVGVVVAGWMQHDDRRARRIDARLAADRERGRI
jgi:putative membrane protein